MLMVDFDPTPKDPAALPASRLVPPPYQARRVAKGLMLGFIAVLVILVLVPWQQTVSGEGRVIAFSPVERRQTLDAPISGRVVRWMKHEGDAVKAGEQVVELADNDPLLVQRLESQRDTVKAQVATYESRVNSLDDLIASYVQARTDAKGAGSAYVRQAEQKVAAARQKLQAAEANLETVILNMTRQRALVERGLISQRDLELAQLSEVKARTERDGAKADLGKVGAEASAKIEDARAKRNSAVADLESARAKLTEMEVKVARQNVRIVTAPRDGTLFRIMAFEGGEQVKQGDPLGVLIPDTKSRAVELWVDGNDAAIVTAQRKVRLQFEGYPAVQFSGWPSVAVGTFGGEVSFVDATDDGKGNFRMVILPDEINQKWPHTQFLRQGQRAKGWILLDQVPLGYELWRRFNGFPPTTQIPTTDSDTPKKKGKDDDSSKDPFGDDDKK